MGKQAEMSEMALLTTKKTRRGLLDREVIISKPEMARNETTFHIHLLLHQSSLTAIEIVTGLQRVGVRTTSLALVFG